MGKEGTSKNLSYGMWAALGGQQVPLFDGAAVVWRGVGGASEGGWTRRPESPGFQDVLFLWASCGQEKVENP